MSEGQFKHVLLDEFIAIRKVEFIAHGFVDLLLIHIFARTREYM